jgi:hypothetical protein
MLTCLLAIQPALLLRPPATRPPLALRGRAVHMALPAAATEFVPESIAGDPAQMKQVEELYKTTVRLYKSEEAALTALRQNSQILLPIYATPKLLQDSYAGLLSAMGNEADALEIMRQNPAVLTCGAAIADETPEEIRKFASIRRVLDQISPEALTVGGVVIIGLIIFKIAAKKLGL